MQHLELHTQLSGEEGVLHAIAQMEGFEAPAIEWERSLLPARVADYEPRWLDQLCLSGSVGWGRVSPHPAFNSKDAAGPRRVIPSSAAPLRFICAARGLVGACSWWAVCGREQAESGINP